CCCDRILTGEMRPNQCPLFGKVCTPLSPQGACMVSTEGGCFSWFSNHRTR
ncbi:MAG: hydrogenase formation protein HypD, partial [Eubacterium sp.]|nr:hydrogenase formation protein HypD [Eubacterium sp.]